MIRTPIIIYRTTSSRRQLVRWLDYGHPSLYSYSTCASDTIPTNSFDLVPFDFTRSVVRVPRYSSGLSTFGVVRASFDLLLFSRMPPRQYVKEPWSSRLLDWWADRVSIHTALRFGYNMIMPHSISTSSIADSVGSAFISARYKSVHRSLWGIYSTISLTTSNNVAGSSCS